MPDNEDFEDLDIEIEDDEEELQEEPIPKSKVPKGTRLTLYFRSTIGPGEKLEKLTVDTSMPVKELQSTLGDLFGLDPNDFHLSANGRTLDSDDIISNYDIEDGQEVLIIPVSTAG